MTTTTIQQDTTITQTVQVIQSGQAGQAPDGAAMGSAFIARIGAGTAKPGELMSLAQQCRDNEIGGLLAVVEQRLAYLAGPVHTNLLVEAMFKALPQCFRMPDGSLPVIRKKPAPPVKTMTIVKDVNGAITGAVVRTGS